MAFAGDPPDSRWLLTCDRHTIVSDETNIFFALDGSIWSAPTDQSSAARRYALNENLSWGGSTSEITADDANVYWIAYSGIRRCPSRDLRLA
jgi:hypothetical protein